MNTTARNTLIFTLLVSAAGMAAAADAQATAPTKPANLFLEADANHDGKLDADEFAKLKQLRQERLQQIQAQHPDFKTLDKDGDGAVTRDEMRAGMASRMMHNGQGAKDGQGAKSGKSSNDCKGANKGKGPRHGDSLYGKADANNDGNLDKAEYAKLLELRKERQARIAAATPDFAALDKNKDGVISKDEMREGMRAMHEKVNSAE
ncbi:MAG: EF-hand domain-containing protein [Aeromonadaceae bacterium]